MRVCIDTNVLVQLFGRNQAARPIREAIMQGRIEWAISNEILFEYQETITRLSGLVRWTHVEAFILLMFRLHSNILFIDPQFRFGLLVTDPDDNKFADCAIAAQADFIITEDRGFLSLARSGYKPRPIGVGDFVRKHL